MNKRISEMTSIVVMGMGVLVVFGWVFDISIIKSGFSGSLLTMKFNTALCFVLAGISLRLLSLRRLTLLVYPTSLMGLIGLLTLCQYAFGWNLGIDQLLIVDNFPSIDRPYPGRMGANTALDFVLMGIALLWLSRPLPSNVRFAQILSSITAVFSLIALLSHLFGVSNTYQLLIHTIPQTPHTALTFLVLYVGILSITSDQGLMQVFTSSLIGGIMARRLLLSLIILNLLLDWLLFKGYQLGWYDLRFAYVLQIIFMTIALCVLISRIAHLFNQIDYSRQQINKNLEILVAERTEELGSVNIQLQKKILELQQIQRALRKSKARFAGILEIAKDGIISVDSEQRIILFNQGAEKIFDYSSEEVLGQPLSLIIPEKSVVPHQDVNQFIQSSSQARQMGERREIKARRRNGTEFLAEASISKLQVEDEIILTAIIRDISERKEVEKALKVSEERYRGVVEDQTELICRFLPDGTILFVNEAYCRYFGVEREKIIGKSYTPIIYEEDREKVTQLVQSMSRENPTVTIVNRVVVNGQILWTQWINRMILDFQENFIEYQSVGRDITDLKTVEEALRSLSNRLQSLISDSSAVIYSCKTKGDYERTYVSENVTEILGYEPNQFLQNSSFWLDHIHPDDQQKLLVQIPQVFTPDDHRHEYRFLRADGTYCWLYDRFKLIRDENGQPLEMIGHMIDISDRKQSELLLEQAKEEAIAANHAKSIFLANMSHELRTPLNAILGFTQLMSYDSSLSPSHQEYCEIINGSGEHLLALINDILDLSQIEIGRIELNLDSCDLYKLLLSLEEMWQLKAQSKRLRLSCERSPHLPQYVKIDEKKVRQVLINLLSNAIKFTPQGSITIRIKSQKTDIVNQEKIYFEVEDTGKGIAPEEIEDIFKIFTQAEAGRRMNQGSGLGLAISEKLVHLMGGQIKVTSILGQGSVFSFEIPVELNNSIQLYCPSLKQRAIALAPGQPKYRILVVEDVLENRRLLVEQIASVGFEVREAKNGSEALILWESWSPHLIWLDMRMPVMDGYETIKRIKADLRAKATVIIALTASVFEDEREAILRTGCDDFVGKPYQEKVIFEKMAQHLGVEYIYETKSPSQKNLAYKKLTPEDLNIMPPEWLEQMYQASFSLDIDLIHELIEQIPPSHVTLANALLNMVNNFHFDQIMELTCIE